MDENLKILPINIKEELLGKIDEHDYFATGKYSSRIGSVLDRYSEFTGISDLIKPVDMGKVTGNWRWDGIIWSNLNEFAYNYGCIRINNRGNYLPMYKPNNTTDNFIIRYIDEEGYQKTDILCHNRWFSHKINMYASKYYRNDEKHYQRWKKMVDNGTIRDFAETRRSRLVDTMSDDEKRIRLYYESKLVKYIVEKKEAKCLFCGSKIHNPRAFASLKNIDAYEEYKDSVGALCCSCYYRLVNDGVFKEHKKISNELGLE